MTRHSVHARPQHGVALQHVTDETLRLLANLLGLALGLGSGLGLGLGLGLGVGLGLGLGVG